MNFQTLQMFCRVIEEKSFSEAARVSFVSQPAVTKQIQQLENHYGIELINRENGIITLTNAGEILYRYAQELIETYKQSEDVVKQMVIGYESTINIGASFTIGEYLLPGILGDFQKVNNDICFNLSIANTPSIITKLEENKINIAFVEGRFENKDYYKEKIVEDELVVVVSNSHPWNEKRVISIDELTQEKIIWREKNAGIRKIVESFLMEHNVLDKIDSEMELGTIQAIKSAVEAELGIAILPKLSVMRELDYGVLKEIEVSGLIMKRELWMVRKMSRFSNDNIDRLSEHVKGHMRVLLGLLN